MTKKKCQKLQEEKKRQELLQEIERTKRAHADTLLNLENMTDPDLIDCYIYELNAVQVRYKFLLRQAKQSNLTNLNPTLLPLTAPESASS
ncbi:MAG: YaaL family protein [Clostridium sp.]|nr:YaaL family protein [Clostridium sp.]